MKPDDSGNNVKPSRNVFRIMNAVRDNCTLSDGLKVLLFTLATYCDRDGVCYPSNRTLAEKTRKSERSIQRALKTLAAQRELEILSSGVGRNKKRVLKLRRYADFGGRPPTVKPDKAMSPLNTTASLGETSCNNHSEQPQVGNKERGSSIPGDYSLAEKGADEFNPQTGEYEWGDRPFNTRR